MSDIGQKWVKSVKKWAKSECFSENYLVELAKNYTTVNALEPLTTNDQWNKSGRQTTRLIGQAVAPTDIIDVFSVF